MTSTAITNTATDELSELEELFLAFCDSHGFRRPEVNCSIEGYLCDSDLAGLLKD